MPNAPDPWERSPEGRAPLPLALGLVLFPLVVLWTLPQTLAGLVFAIFRAFQGHRLGLYRFGPFLFLVAQAHFPFTAGISLGVVVFAEEADILEHEFCHLWTGLWLSWLYLPVYGLEYLIAGHARSPHERITCRLERANRWGWQRLGGSGRDRR